MDRPKIYNPDLPWIVVFSDGLQCHLIDRFLLKSEAEHLYRGLSIFLKDASSYLYLVNPQDKSTWLTLVFLAEQSREMK